MTGADERRVLGVHGLTPYLPLMRSCSKCADPAQVAMSFDYAARAVYLRDIGPGFDRYCEYAMCEMHASRLRPPGGWTMTDGRTELEPPLFLSTDVA